MLAPSRGRLVQASAAAVAVPITATIPSFLAPALFHPQTQTPSSRAHFSQTASHPSKLGRTPISIPPGVELIVGEPFVKKDPTTYLKIPKRIVTVKGPLGELGVPIPPYLKIDHDVEARKAVLSIEDKTEKRQMEMWGEFIRTQCHLVRRVELWSRTVTLTAAPFLFGL